MKNSTRQIFLATSLLAISTVVGGCSTDENPITPDKMSQIRKQEADQRANFNPDMSKPAGQ